MIEFGWALPCGLLDVFELPAQRDAVFPWGVEQEDGIGVFTGALDQALKGRLGSPSASPTLSVTQKAQGSM